jgi:hypothetical protein
LQLISGGKDQFTVFSVCLHTPWLGHGSSGVGERNYRNFVSLFDLNMIIHAYGLAVHVRYMKGSRSAFIFLYSQYSFITSCSFLLTVLLA